MRQEIDLEKIKQTYEALDLLDKSGRIVAGNKTAEVAGEIGTVSAPIPADGADYAWGEVNHSSDWRNEREEQVRAIKGKYAHIEITHEREEQQPWQKSIMERLARMEQELAALQKRLDEYEGEL